MIRIRDITHDENGAEVEVYCVEVPTHVQVEGGAAVDAYVAEYLNPPDVPDSAENPPTPAEGQE